MTVMNGFFIVSVAKLCKTAGMKVWGLVNTIPSDELRSPYVDEYWLVFIYSIVWNI